MSGEFNGFSKDFVAFFKELKANNNRDWFAENKQRYKDVVQYPLSDFIAALAPHLEDIAPCYIADPRPNRGSMFRIYRDVRFSKDQRPYKEHAACQFRHQAGRDAHAPGYYIHLGDDSVRFGGGIWMPPAPKLTQIREAIDEHSDTWLSILEDPDFIDTFGQVDGASLKRAPKGYDIDHPMIEHLKRKSFFIMHEIPVRHMFSKSLVDDVADAYEKGVPFMRFLTNAVGLPF